MKAHLDALALTAPFEGGRACLWLYTVSHGTAVVRLQKDDAEGFLVLSDCAAMRLPTSWTYVVPRISPLPGEPHLIMVSCEQSGVAIECGWVEMRDNYPAYGEIEVS